MKSNVNKKNKKTNPSLMYNVILAEINNDTNVPVIQYREKSMIIVVKHD